MAQDTLKQPPVDPDELDAHVAGAGVWSLPGNQDAPGVAGLPPGGFDYAGGMLVGHGEEADAQPPGAHPQFLRAPTNEPRAFEVAHEATHRRFEPPKVVPIVQAAAGFTMILAPNQGLHFIKLISLFLTLDAAGTIKFTQGSSAGTEVSAAAGPGDLSGLMAMGGAAASPLVLQPAPIESPWLFTAPDQALGIFTVTGKAAGFAVVCYSPYDA